MDYARRTYKTKFRPFRDRPDVLVDLQWYAVPPGAPKLPFRTSFMSQDWTSSTETRNDPNYQDEPWLQRPGEVFNEPRPFSPFHTPLGLDFLHVCGTEEQFQLGAVYDGTANVLYDEQGLPLCCGAPVVPFFPVVLGFELTVEDEFFVYPDCPDAEVGDYFHFTGPGEMFHCQSTDLATRFCFATADQFRIKVTGVPSPAAPFNILTGTCGGGVLLEALVAGETSTTVFGLGGLTSFHLIFQNTIPVLPPDYTFETVPP